MSTLSPLEAAGGLAAPAPAAAVVRADVAAPAAAHALGSVEGLRGLAAAAVTWFHLAWATDYPAGALKASGTFGYLGVDAFFVISGFILPWVLRQRAYRVRSYGRFLLKRIVRLEPPYLVAVVGALIALYVASRVSLAGDPGRPFDVTLPEVLLHVAYLNQVLSVPAFNPVFWSLAIEMQWYLVLGVLYPLLVSPRPAVRLGLVAVMGIVGYLIPTHVLLFHYAPLFAVGILAFQRKARVIGAREFTVGLAIAAVAVGVTVGVPSTLVALASAAIIARVEFRHPVVLWLGTISYSLYLVHWPVGGHLVNAAVKVGVSGLPLTAVLAAAVALSLLVAQLLYWCAERPSRALAARVAY